MTREWTPDEILETVRAFQPACVIVAAADLDVFTALADGPMTAETAAARMDADLRATTILLNALTALELLAKGQDGYSVRPEIAESLSDRSPANILPGVRHLANCLSRWTQLARVVRSGKPAERIPSIRGQAADTEAFIGAMNNFTESVAPEIVGRLKHLKFQRLLDIGGASGTWTIAFLRAVPEARATLFDLPDVIELARRRLTAEGLLDRVTLVAGDYNHDDLPAGADLAWLSAIAHQNSRSENQALYRKIHTALAPGGTLVVRDIVMDRSRTSPPAGAMFAVNMLVATDGGNAYTFDEYRDDLTAAGFTQVELLHETGDMNTLIRAVKAL